MRNNRGQTAVEYLLLLAVAFITTFIMMSGPIGNYVGNFITAMQTNMQNFIKNSEWGPDEVDLNDPEHPSSPQRLRPLHFDSGIIFYEEHDSKKIA
ncbi:MAG: hypothetical protein KDD51_16685 [Bdellovibrionales bacterium]|nr:hypothetical protein [Bdellovibrionales bacterium]